ncbi:hypothetical protein [Succinatimonas hippei]|uniref:hypothetical protein n=1 Tax=Succinatimonas hippei TaxID=626938 RepID=UPI0023F7FED8|nr:hypothetical protein [Succinatimonas hippei]
MIILISGATHSGKTFLASKLMEKLSMPYLSLDHLKMGENSAPSTTLIVASIILSEHFLIFCSFVLD